MSGNIAARRGEIMTIAEWCIFGTLMLYLLTIGAPKWIAFRQFDNSRPRDAAFYADPIRARALAAPVLRSRRVAG
jgi:uncharacterized MAPEG superfamily protein